MTLLLKILVFLAIVGAGIAFLSQEPNFPAKFVRAVPSKHSPAEISLALRDPKNWPVFHHSLKNLKGPSGDLPSSEETTTPGTILTFIIEPRDKPWKRREIRAEVVATRAGEAHRFRLLSESSGKMEKILGDIEWWLSLSPAEGRDRERGFLSVVTGGVTAVTKTARARVFGRAAETILMNQIYPIDLVKLANYEIASDARKTGTEPVYK